MLSRSNLIRDAVAISVVSVLSKSIGTRFAHPFFRTRGQHELVSMERAHEDRQNRDSSNLHDSA